MNSKSAAIKAADVEARRGTTYPQPYRRQVEDRSKRQLGEHFGLTRYGVNLVELPPGAWSAQRHWHSHEDEFVYVLTGELTLITDAGEEVLTPGMVAGFPAGVEDGHHLVNRSGEPASYLEVGDRNDADEVFYPDIDLELRRDDRGRRVFRRRSGEAY